jgi:hypothetical protein
MCLLDRALLLHEEAHCVLWMKLLCGEVPCVLWMKKFLLCGGAQFVLWMEQLCIEKHAMCYGWNSSTAIWRKT